MKRLFTTLLCILSLSIFAQNDSASLGSGAANMVFYSLSTGAKTTAPNDDWHIAFAGRYINGFTYASTSRAAAIRNNEAYGLKLFRCPNQKLAQWAELISSGRIDRHVEVVDIAPTLARILRVPAPAASEGKLLPLEAAVR